MPNTFAYIALFSWPLVVAVLFLRKDPLSAGFWSVVGGYLLLPQKVAVDLPLVPPLDKTTIPALSAMLAARFLANQRVAWLTSDRWVRWILIGLLITPFFTLIGNGSPIISETRYVPAYTLYDAFTSSINRYLTLLPLVIGMAFVRTIDDLQRVSRMMVVAVLAYSLLILFEIRMSPQLHTWIYGFFPHSFGQQMRFDGFRAVVFLGHGLLTSLLVAVGLIMAATQWRARTTPLVLPWPLITLYLLTALVLSKSLGAVLLGAGATLALFFIGHGWLRRGALIIATAILGYPLLKFLGATPVELVANTIGDTFPERLESFLFRVKHETALFDHALQKPLVGWGSWGRNRLDDSVTDGYWIITFGMWGACGYLLHFALPWFVVYRMSSVLKESPPPYNARTVLVGVTLLLTILMVDQIPNASANSLFWYFVGCGLGVGVVLKSPANARQSVNSQSFTGPKRGVAVR